MYHCGSWVPASLLATLLRLAGKGADAPRLTQPFEMHPTRARDTFGVAPPFSCAEELYWTVEQIRKAG